MTEAATRASSSSKYQSSHQESVTAAALAKKAVGVAPRPNSAASASSSAAGASSDTTRLQRHRSYHSQSKSQRKRLDRFQDQQPHHRRATSVRVRPTYIEADEDPNLPQPPVSIQVASPEDEEEIEVAKTLGHRYFFTKIDSVHL